jgi:hypothetical protein
LHPFFVPAGGNWGVQFACLVSGSNYAAAASKFVSGAHFVADEYASAYSNTNAAPICAS